MNALNIAADIAAGKISVADAAAKSLQAIKNSDDELNIMLYVDDDVMDRAKSVQKSIDNIIADGGKLPPLAGVPVIVKDNMCRTDKPTTCGSRILENYKPPYDATVVKRMEESLMVVLGNANMDEFAMGSSTEHSYYKNTKNPWDTSKVPGGSSGGSAAAVAADYVPITLGSDTGGSIRQPSAFCGVTGLKPTYGSVSRYGLVAFASSLDQIGPMAHTAKECAAVFDVINGYDKYDSTSLNTQHEIALDGIDKPISDLTIALPTQYMGEGIAPDVKQAVLDACEVYKKLGCKIIEVSIPSLDYALPAYYLLSSAEASSNLQRFDGVRYGFRAEDAKDNIDLYVKTRSAGFGPEVKRRIMLGVYALCSGYYDEYYKKALKVRSLVKQGFDKVFEQADVILSPTSPFTAFGFDEKSDALSMYLADICTISVNIAGLPAISYPGGFSNGLPIGIQAIGKPLSEAKLLNFVNAYQNVTDWHTKKPGMEV